jgi:hypothetical protein
MPKYEYDVINLKAEVDVQDRRCFKWQSKRGGCREVDQDGLETILNSRGEQGWAVVAFDTDARFGSRLVLMRELPNDAPTEVAPKVTRRATAVRVAPSPPVDLAPLVVEIQALRRQLAALPAPQVHVAAPAVNFDAVAEQLRSLLPARRELSASLSPEAAERIGVLFERALAAALRPQLVAIPEPPTLPWWQPFLRRLGFARA